MKTFTQLMEMFRSSKPDGGTEVIEPNKDDIEQTPDGIVAESVEEQPDGGTVFINVLPIENEDGMFEVVESAGDFISGEHLSQSQLDTLDGLGYKYNVFESREALEESKTIHVTPHNKQRTQFRVTKGIKGQLDDGEIIHDSHIDDLHDSGYKVKIHEAEVEPMKKLSELQEWSHPDEVAAGKKLAAADKPRTEDEERRIASGALHGDYKGHRMDMIKKYKLYTSMGPKPLKEGDITEGTDEDLTEGTITNTKDGKTHIVVGNDYKHVTTFSGHKLYRGVRNPNSHILVAPDDTIHSMFDGPTETVKKNIKAFGLKRLAMQEGVVDDNEKMQLTELSKDTLQSYVRKSGREITGKLVDRKMRALTPEQWSSAAHKQQKRQDSQELAKKKVAAAGLKVPASLKESADALSREIEPALDESWGHKVHSFKEFKQHVQDHADCNTVHGKVSFITREVNAGGKKWHQTSGIVHDHMHHGGDVSVGHFNHTGKAGSEKGYGQTLGYGSTRDDD